MTVRTREYPLLAVIGGGASGLAASVSAARQAENLNKKVRIVLFEANPRVGKKLLVTGNGRCNLSNRSISPGNYTGSRALFQKVYAGFGGEETLRFFESLGVLTVSDADGRIYPKSMKASSVLDALMFECERLGVETRVGTRITSLKTDRDGVLLNGSVRARAAVAACGGLAGGGETSVYDIFASNGIIITPPEPGLTAFTVKDFPKSLKGVRAQGKMTLYTDARAVGNETGEIQYTDYGLSGYPAMQLSLRMPVKKAPGAAVIRVDSLSDVSYEELDSAFAKRRAFAPDMPAILFLSGMLPKPLAAVFIKDARLPADCTLGAMTREQAGRLFEQCKNKEYRVQGLRGFLQAQVTRGGIAAGEIGDSLMLKKMPRVYVCGELADVAGECGGYNLQWAWSSGCVAGRNCVLENF